MRIVNEPISNESIKEEMREYFYKIKNIDNADFSIPEKYEIVTKLHIKILVAISFWLIFPLFWYFNKRKQLKKILNDRVKIDIKLEDYNIFLNLQTTHFNKIEINDGTIQELVEKRNIAVNNFHIGSYIDSEIWSQIYKIKFYHNYFALTQKVVIHYHYYTTERYKDSKGRTRTRRVRHDRSWKEAITIIKIDFFKNGNIFITSNIRSSLLEKHELENKKFNKIYKIRTNDRIQTNVIFTLYSQELLVKDNGNGFTTFELNNKNFIGWGKFFGGLELTDDIQYSIAEMKKGKEEIKKISFELWSRPIFNLNNLFTNILILPIWNVKKNK
ncbi:MAG: hypothetical protein HRT99_00855 [Mycoplasmatales bacterium]|nr:hypothetical protein [Mycoplasmatales bacterium]